MLSGLLSWPSSHDSVQYIKALSWESQPWRLSSKVLGTHTLSRISSPWTPVPIRMLKDLKSHHEVGFVLSQVRLLIDFMIPSLLVIQKNQVQSNILILITADKGDINLEMLKFHNEHRDGNRTQYNFLHGRCHLNK